MGLTVKGVRAKGADYTGLPADHQRRLLICIKSQTFG
ncbi:hypothetical protein PMO01_15410 [Pseudomonas moraviensis R28-S]|uniref:Uncharacterized protein n=1 Tax=Pseudomonas moraviensis R28-S TaxID=1395516 RepID=V8R7E2_9PSED|nr:hypothetical protein PMO01_15410 [Pseudomonas moraviensis R28-S]